MPRGAPFVAVAAMSLKPLLVSMAAPSSHLPTKPNHTLLPFCAGDISGLHYLSTAVHNLLHRNPRRLPLKKLCSV